jgi:hypothetical protein
VAVVHQGSVLTELWTVEQAAAHWQVSLSRARAILAARRIKRVSGYPADEIRAVELRQGARTDLAHRRVEDSTPVRGGLESRT